MAHVLLRPKRYSTRCQLIRDSNHGQINLALALTQTIFPSEGSQVCQNIEYPVFLHAVLFQIG
jgi:hypothetical protein